MVWHLFFIITLAAGDFVFVDFNWTQGLVLNGDASTSACADIEIRSYGPNEANDKDGALETVVGEDLESSFETTVRTHSHIDIDEDKLAGTTQVAGHRDSYGSERGRCAGRLRLTPSQPHSRGSFWYHTRRPVFGGFETIFTFKVSDHSRQCTRHRAYPLRKRRRCHALQVTLNFH